MPSNTASDILGTIVIATIVIGVLIGIAVILIGMRLKRQRDAGEQELIERRVAAHVDTLAPTAPEEVPEALVTATPPPTTPVPLVDETPIIAPLPVAAEPSVETPPVVTTPTPAASADGDITQLKGLGPKLAATLAELGYTRLDQIAALTPEQAIQLDAQLGAFQGRMARDRWIEQATLLVAGDRAGYEAEFGKLG